ncbi:hypothetical protein BG846_01971 [Streptomyces fradiae ATCC 10745 = DSM 40063]|uniref:Uncharacterized protein n=1 Tax=Streptomyces fradiae ATCC 10745 = DSM 40063 TaxID=1319510 RepID=A0A1Y2NXS7_STRFR|nr:hypothetical protein BG846_01971 [Streptomyces fradiae ATCC 10745 = DSM 40063]
MTATAAATVSPARPTGVASTGWASTSSPYWSAFTGKPCSRYPHRLPAPSTVNQVRRDGTHARNAAVRASATEPSATVASGPAHQAYPSSWALVFR